VTYASGGPGGGGAAVNKGSGGGGVDGLGNAGTPGIIILRWAI
jgi:hypothetical protein